MKPADPIVIVQALDGRWNYGPQSLRLALEAEDFGTFPTMTAALSAAKGEPQE